MNERILDICIKAGINTWPFNEVGFISLDESELVKFAELIVGHAIECVRDVLRDENSDLSYGAASQVQNRIKEHFGVEE